MTICTELVNGVVDILEHVKEVETSIVELSKDATLEFSKAVQNSDIALSDEFMSALQYQDILSQQLSATIEAIDISTKQIREYVDNFECQDSLDSHSSRLLEDFKNLGNNIKEAVDSAKTKQEVFGGRALNSLASSEIDFF